MNPERFYSQMLTGPKGRPLRAYYRITDAEPGHLPGFQVEVIEAA